MFQYHILGIRRLIRRGAVYGFLFGAVPGCTLLVLAAAARLAPARFGFSGPELWLAAGAIGLGTVLVSVLYPRARQFVDRRLYGDVYDYTQAIRGITREAQGAAQPRDVVIRILERVVALMGLEGYLLAEDVGHAPSEILSGGVAAPRLQKAIARPNFIPTGASSTRDLDGEPVLAMRLGEDTALWLGPKAGGESFRQDDINLAEPLATLVGMLLVRLQLANELRDLNRRLITAEEEERARLAMDVHDGPLQKALYLAKQPLPPEKVADMAQALARDLRALSTSLWPPALDDLGLYYAIDWLARSVAGQHGIEVTVDSDEFPEETRLDPAVELALYRSIQESLNNVAKHAQATRTVVVLALAEGAVTAEVRDNGIGMEAARHRQAIAEGHLGLVGIRERLGHVDGRLRVQSEKGAGTTVTMVVSIAPRPNAAPVHQP